MADTSLLNIFEQISCREKSIKGLLSPVNSNAKKYLIFTASGIILCKQKLSQEQQGLSNILIAHDVIFKTNAGTLLNLPELFVMVDQITAFHPLEDNEYERIARLIEK